MVLLPDLAPRLALRGVLRRSGYAEVLEAHDLVSAQRILGESRVDLVLTVWDDGEVSGPELFRSLRTRGVNRNLPVVLLDLGLPQHQVVAAIKAGVVGKLRLPTSVEQVRMVLEQQKSHSESA